MVAQSEKQRSDSMSTLSQKFLTTGWHDINNDYEYKITCMNKKCTLYAYGYRYHARLRNKQTRHIVAIKAIMAQDINGARQQALKLV